MWQYILYIWSKITTVNASKGRLCNICELMICLVCMSICMCAFFIYVCIHACMYLANNECLYACMHICILQAMYVCTYECMYVSCKCCIMHVCILQMLHNVCVHLANIQCMCTLGHEKTCYLLLFYFKVLGHYQVTNYL